MLAKSARKDFATVFSVISMEINASRPPRPHSVKRVGKWMDGWMNEYS